MEEEVVEVVEVVEVLEEEEHGHGVMMRMTMQEEGTMMIIQEETTMKIQE